MLTPEAFEQIRGEICTSGPPSDGDDLLGMEIDFCAFLGEGTYSDEEPELWRDVSVSRTEGGVWLIQAVAYGAQSDAQEIATALPRIWMEHLRYGYREGHTIVQTENDVRLQAVTQIDPHDLWVTAQVQVLLRS